MKYLSLRSAFGSILLACLLYLSVNLNAVFSFPYPPFNTFPQHEDYLVDLGGIMMGLRRVAADIAWVQLMQYYARGEMSKKEQLEIEYRKIIAKDDDHDDDKTEYGGGHWHADRYHPDFDDTTKGFPGLYEKTLRIIYLDPFFHYVYLYSAGALAWNLDRYDQAYDILRRGMENDPSYWRFSLYLGAIIYKEKGEFQKMVDSLEKVVNYPDSPNLIKSILANYYEKTKQYYKSLALWIRVYESDDESYHHRSAAQIQELQKILNIQ